MKLFTMEYVGWLNFPENKLSQKKTRFDFYYFITDSCQSLTSLRSPLTKFNLYLERFASVVLLYSQYVEALSSVCVVWGRTNVRIIPKGRRL